MRRWICRRKGHRIDPDPGDFLLLCTRCGACVDMHEVLAAVQANRTAKEASDD